MARKEERGFPRRVTCMNRERTPTDPVGVEPWMVHLKAAVEAGYYRTEADEDKQTRFPWQDHTCGDCPFWVPNTCLVRGTRREARDATCRYFDPWNYPEAESIMQYNTIRPLQPHAAPNIEDQVA
jgi:hypothetical protein